MDYPPVISALLSRLPGCTDIRVSPPALSTGFWHIDFSLDDQPYVIQHQLGGTINISRLCADTPPFTPGADEELRSPAHLSLYLEEQRQGPYVLVHRCANGNGETFSLSPASVQVLARRFGDDYLARPSITLAPRPGRKALPTIDKSELNAVVYLLTGIRRFRLGGIIVKDPVIEVTVTIVS